ncbi:sugar porter family MFS transporter [Catenulispora pinisilvae]|uniref:sugar porter family MFS transporter n=1 Tax=Catenulispora pinisilvae TaxID=2705253 RepID=UPI001891732F|nr:sugar porter family MFS transporter [Catenulispora pinisilvae]
MQGFSREPGTTGPITAITLPKQGERRVWGWAIIIAVGGFLFGFDTGVVSGALLYIAKDFHLSNSEKSSVVSVLLIGAMIGALVAGRISDTLGRKKTVTLFGLVFAVGTLIAVVSQNYGTLIVARFVLGLAVGGASAQVPVYLGEISPANIRGRILSLNQLLITVGILCSYLIDLAFSHSGNWRAMFAFGAIPALVLSLGVWFVVPESPTWLFGRGRIEQLRQGLLKVTDGEQADEIIEVYRQRTEQAARQEAARGANEKGWRILLTPAVRPAMIVGVTMAALQQFGGINTIIYYAPTIIEQTGRSASNSIIYSVYIGIINFVMTVVAINTIDRLGRRQLLLISLAGMAGFVALLGFSFIWNWNSNLTLLFMVAYIAAFAGGLGPVFWVLVGEIFPTRAKADGSSAATTVNWLSNFIVSQSFLTVANGIGQGQTFLIFAGVCVVGLMFVGRYVPETKNRDTGEVQTALFRRFGMKPVPEARASTSAYDAGRADAGPAVNPADRRRDRR